MSREKDIDTLARTMWGEARDQGIEGLTAVANTVMNRLYVAVEAGGNYWWGNSVARICKRKYQFSVWLENDPNFPKMRDVTPDNKIFAKCLELAEDAVDGHLEDITNGATHYHRVGHEPNWAALEDVVSVIGDHIFYRPKEVPPVIQPFYQPQNTPISDDGYELAFDYSYEWKHKGEINRIYIKKGYKYDGASVPNALGWIVDIHPDGQNRAAALVHDVLYDLRGDFSSRVLTLTARHQIKRRGKWEDVGVKWTRKSADKMFARLLREADVPKFKRRLSYAAVRAGGWTYWNT